MEGKAQKGTAGKGKKDGKAGENGEKLEPCEGMQRPNKLKLFQLAGEKSN